MVTVGNNPSRVCFNFVKGSAVNKDSLPAILGGAPAFDPPLAFTRPALPAYSALAPEFEDIVQSGMLTKGPRLARLEDELKAYLKSPHLVCVSSCTSGLMLGIQAMKLEGEVIVPSFSFMATFHALRWNNLKPVFVDCNPDALTINLQAIEQAITPRTSAVMSAYVFGNPPDLVGIERLCARHQLAHFCDSAHGLGTLIGGEPPGTGADFEVFSCSPTKLLTAAEGGVVSTRHAYIEDWIRRGRDYGNPGSYDCDFAGLNARMSEFHAALMSAGLPHLESYVQRRTAIVAAYRARLEHVPGIRFQAIAPEVRSSYKDFTIFVEAEAFGLSRDRLGQALKAEGIPTRAYFDPPGHQLTAYQQDLALPVTRKMCQEVLSLPISTVMTDEEVERCCDAIASIQQRAPDIDAAPLELAK